MNSKKLGEWLTVTSVKITRSGTKISRLERCFLRLDMFVIMFLKVQSRSRTKKSKNSQDSWNGLRFTSHFLGNLKPSLGNRLWDIFLTWTTLRPWQEHIGMSPRILNNLKVGMLSHHQGRCMLNSVLLSYCSIVMTKITKRWAEYSLNVQHTLIPNGSALKGDWNWIFSLKNGYP